MSDDLPLKNLRVLDLTRVRAGPTCVRQLTDWGAEAIKIESPDADGFADDRDGPDFQNIHRNKRSLTLNLKHPDGKEVLMRLVRDADVLVENFRPDVKIRLGIDYETLGAINPRLVYASISGFGQDGPYHRRPGVDQIVQGMGGLMSITGEPGGGPMRVGIAINDVAAGVFAAMGILIALLERHQSDKGQWVQASLLEAGIAFLDFQAARWLLNGEIPVQVGNDHPTGAPTGVYPTTDGHINVAAPSDPMWLKLCKALDARELSEDIRLLASQGRCEHRDFVNDALATILRTRTSDEWISHLNDAGIPCGPIYKIDQVFDDPQVRHLKIAQDVSHPVLGRQVLVGQAVQLSRTPSRLRSPTPAKGEHSEDILRDLGYSISEISNFRSNGTI